MGTSKEKGRDEFRTRLGFIVACIGSAVGMGNIWMFPYRTGKFGGAAFLIPYFIFVILLGFSGVIGEMAFGRGVKAGPIGAFSKAMEMRFGEKAKTCGKVIGMIPVIGSLGIAIGYSVVVGWFLKYLCSAVAGSLTKVEDMGAYFGELAVDFGSVGWQLLGLALTFLIMVLGVTKGIEKMNKIMMPVFFIFFIILMIRVATLPGASDGYRYLFVPEWEKLGDIKTWVYALGQAFFSLSLAGSGTLVYGSYLKKDIDIVGCAKNVAFFDTCAALLAGIVVIPAVFAFGLDVASGPPLMFITLPAVFQQMPFGGLFAVIFFVAVLFAAITSLMNLFETPIEALQEQFRLSRKAAVGVIALVSAVIGVFIESGDSVGAWMDVVSIYIIPLGALLAGIMFFWVCPKGYARSQVEMGAKKPLGRWFEPVTKYIFVGITLVVYVLGIFFGGIG
ncbi:sodium-dependent transporter [Dorea acetigenes]|uniref:Sodium-dependent transporter n=1 Tax=Dorea acetigenes TaxID=2981787 RepID=A0ABT2RR23_9FIRM|nr:sodium-dependent transporter [Dorea acetigenes]MCU6687873.1 sodium-dependent transporter [Dorea acetigenes]SCJ59110.1 Na+-dependent transporters of the SNF family [uncultured Clostridium sp.]